MALIESRRVLDEFLQMFTCSACKNATNEFFNIGKTCKHIFCSQCTTKFGKSSFVQCPTCFIPLEKKVTKCILATNLHEYLINVREAMNKVTNFSGEVSDSTQDALKSLKSLFGDTAPKRTFADFAATQRVNDVDEDDPFVRDTNLMPENMDLDDSTTTSKIFATEHWETVKQKEPKSNKTSLNFFASPIGVFDLDELPRTPSPQLKRSTNLFASQIVNDPELDELPPSPQFKVPFERKIATKKKPEERKELTPKFDSPEILKDLQPRSTSHNRRRPSFASKFRKEESVKLCESQDISESTCQPIDHFKVAPMGGLSTFTHKTLFDQKLGSISNQTAVEITRRRSAPLPKEVQPRVTPNRNQRSLSALVDNFDKKSTIRKQVVKEETKPNSRVVKEETPDFDPDFFDQTTLMPLDTLSPSPTHSHNTRKRFRLSQEKAANVKFEDKLGENKTAVSTSKFSKEIAPNSISSLSSSEEILLDQALNTKPINRDLISLTPKNNRGRSKSFGGRKTSLRAPLRPGELHVINAVLSRDFRRVQALIQAGVNVNERDSRDGSTPLFLAVNIGHLEMCRILLDAGAITNAHCTNDYETALHVAVRKNFIEITRLLMLKGANKGAGNLRKQTPLDCLNSLPSEEAEKMRRVLGNTRGRQSSKEITYHQRYICIPPGQGIDQPLVVNFKMAQLFQSVTETIDDQTTHLVVGGAMPNGTAQYSLLIVEAMARGIMIVSSKYLEECIKRRAIPHNEGTFEIRRIFRDDVQIMGSEGSCREMRLRELLMKPRLFVGANFFLVSQHYACFDRSWLRQLILSGGGQVVNREPTPVSGAPSPFYDTTNRAPYFALVCPNDLNNPYLKTVTSKKHLTVISPTWIIDCILTATFRSDVY